MNVKKIKIFGVDLSFQDKELTDPRVFKIKGIDRSKKR